MKTEFEPRVRRSQRDYRLPFKLVVVGEVGRGELRYELMLRTRFWFLVSGSTVLSRF